jgi:hypothetical protein
MKQLVYILVDERRWRVMAKPRKPRNLDSKYLEAKIDTTDTGGSPFNINGLWMTPAQARRLLAWLLKAMNWLDHR